MRVAPRSDSLKRTLQNRSKGQMSTLGGDGLPERSNIRVTRSLVEMIDCDGSILLKEGVMIIHTD